MIGDPPNIMIGSAANLSFLDFLENTGLPCVIALAIVIFVMKILYKKKPEAEGNKVKFIINLDEDKAVVNLTLMKQSIFMIILIVAAFTAHGVIGLEPSVIALTAAVVMMIIGKQDIDEIISDAEWSTLMFFFGLFIVVGVLSKQVSLNNCHYL